MSDIGQTIVILVILVLIFAAGIMGGRNDGYARAFSEWEKRCVEAKVGRWTIDPETGKAEFRLGCESNGLTPEKK